MRMAPDALVERARAAESAGFDGLALMDHLAPPVAEDQPMYEAIVTAGWLLARTERLIVSHLVLCDSMRHPSVLARQAVSLQEFSGGRFELGIGSGSVPAELARYGLGAPSAPERTARLAESLAVMRALWSGTPVTHEGEYFSLADAQQLPVPTPPVPVLVGGSGPKTLRIVAEYADWWNLPVHQLDRLATARTQIGSARVSVQMMVAYIADESRRETVTELARRRFGFMSSGLVIGNASEISARLDDLGALGVERVYLWFTDFADPATLAAFGDQVIRR